MNNLRIVPRLLLGFLLLSPLPLAGLAWLYLQAFEESLSETVQGNLAAIADKKSAQIETYLGERIDDSRQLAAAHITHETLERLAADPDDPAATAFCDYALALFEGAGYYDLLLSDAEGNVLFSILHESDLGTNLDTGPYRDSILAHAHREALARQATQVTPAARYAGSGNRTALFVVTPVLYQGSALGTLALQLDLERLTQVTADATGLGSSGETVLAQLESGAAGPEALYVGPLQRVADAAFRHRVPLPEVAPPMQAALRGEQDRGRTRDYVGVEVIAAWRHLRFLNWGMVVKQDLVEALAPVARLRTYAIGALGLLLVASAVLAVLFGQGLVGSIRQLTAATRRLAGGDPDFRATPQGCTEFRELADDFNRMADRIREGQTLLERRVAERTRALEEAKARYDELTNRIPVGVYCFRIRADGQMAFEYVSPPFCRALGVEAEAVLADVTLAFRAIHPDELESFVARNREVAQTLAPFVWEGRFLIDGEVRWFRIESAPTPLPNGDSLWNGVMTDITESKQTQRVFQESEERFRQLFENMASGAVVYAAVDDGDDFLIQDINGAVERIESLCWEEILGRRVTEAFPGVEAFGLLEVLRRVRRTGRSEHFPLGLYRDGRIAGWRENFVYRLSTGEVVAIYEDITAQKQAEEALRASETRLRSIFERANTGIAFADAEGNLIQFNDSFMRLLGFPPEELRGMNFAQFTHPDDIPKELDFFREIQAGTRQEYRLEKRYVTRQGDLVWVDLAVNTIRDEAGRPINFVGLVVDITTRKQSQFEYQAILNTTMDGFWINDLEGRFLDVNDAYCAIVGYSREELLNMRIPDLEAEERPEETATHIRKILVNGSDRFETRHRRRDGALIDVEVSVNFLAVGGGRMVAFLRDITERKHANAELRLAAHVFEHSGEAIVITGRDNRILSVNAAFTRLTGYSADEVRGRDPKFLSAGRTDAETYRQMWEALQGVGFWMGELWDRRKDGAIYPKLLTVSVVRSPNGEVENYIGSFTDITERKAAEDRIRHVAHHDALTGLPNRLHLLIGLEQTLAAARRTGEQVALIFIDLDHFKVINDTLGHPVGDGLLVEVARRLRNCVRDSDLLARLGGDEFVVAIGGRRGSNGAARVAEKILAALPQPCEVGPHSLRTTPSLGISVFPGDGEDIETLMKHADTAMYHAKSNGRNTYRFFSADMNRAAADRLHLENRLHTALAEGQFLLHYQPQVDPRMNQGAGRMIGVEALVRWRHPEEGLIGPDRFIPIAEETGLIVPLGEWVLETACAQLHQWLEQGRGLRMAVNISQHQLRSPRLLERVAELVERYSLAHRGLELEITESVAMQDRERTIETLHRLREMGVELAIDDFGTGYSSLSYLKLLPIQRLKLDRSFVKDIETDANDAAICSATIALAHALGLEVVAEGVESVAQRDFLNELECDLMQGYLFSRPVPMEELPGLGGEGL